MKARPSEYPNAICTRLNIYLHTHILIGSARSQLALKRNALRAVIIPFGVVASEVATSLGLVSCIMRQRFELT